jgi:two-component system, response regulator RegA
MTEATAPSLLVVDDDDAFRERLRQAFERRGYDVRTAANAADALSQARSESPELAVVDLRMPNGSGLELVRDLKHNDPATRVVVLTGYGSIATAIEAMRLGATHYLSKPATADEVLAAFQGGAAPAEGSATSDAPPGGADATPTLARAEWEHIQRVLGDVGGNVSEAARRLGLHRRSLQRKLQKHPPNR